ncbi:SurA N-terminal domain-containing protein [Sphingobium phenoxybenzoativorans]|uniref:SurA N-terminal domain-containing protein n=1 Tax=Sphingobium phenoxybenzoativorans TaxID=1592790 RepID=A0A975Q026_9SPHN|nr:peptidylprolyl isomerase [Sphingobium phenoxybenzoativorans]QUT04314.1 SurA N-terminal domain-containing protein [Sphingobium phenoxybenzoativorans]
MLSFFRRFLGSKVGTWIALGFLAIIGIAFAMGDITGNSQGGGITSLFGGAGSNAAKVGGSALSSADLQSRSQRVFEQERRNNPTLQIASFLAQGGVDQVYDQLVAGLSIAAFGKNEGMSVSKRMVDGQIAAIPAFQDASGNFSQDIFRRALAGQNVSEKLLRDDITQEIMGKQVVGPATLGVRLPDSLVLPYASLLLEARAGRIAAIPSEAFVPATAPTDAQLAAYYKANAGRYTIPEQRRLRYAVIDLSRFAAAAQPSDAEIGKYYNDNKTAYAATETRSFEQLILPTEAAAKTVAADVTGGKTLAAAAQSAGLSVSTLAGQTQAQLAATSSAAIAAQGFAAPQGGLVGPVRAPLGWSLLRVTAIDRKPAQTLDQVRPQITETLRGQKEQALLSDFTGKIEDQIGNGATFDEAVKDNGLTIENTPLLVSNGQNVEDQAYKANPDVLPLLKPGFDMAADDDAQIVPIVQDKRYALLKVGDIAAAAPPPLVKVRELVVAQYKLAQGAIKAKAVAEQIRAKVAKGAKLEEALAAAGVPLPPVQKAAGRRADLMRGDKAPPPPLALMFNMAKGTIKALPIGQDRGYFLVQLDQVQQEDAAGQPQLVEQVRGQLGNVVGNEYAQQFEKAIEKDLKVARNMTVVTSVKQELRRANGGGEQ